MNRLGERFTTAGRERQFTLSLVLLYSFLILAYLKVLWIRIYGIYCLWILVLLLPAMLPRLRSEKPELKLMLLFAAWVLFTRILHWDVKAFIGQCRSGNFPFSVDILLAASSAMIYVAMAACLIVRGRDRERLLDGIAIVTVLFSTVVGLICLYGVLYKTDIPTPFRGRYLCMFNTEARLYPLGKHPNTGCMWFFLGIFFSAYLFCRTKKRLCRAGLILAALLNYLMLAMTFSRNGMLAFSLCTGLLVLVLALRRFSPKTVGKKLLCTVVILGLTVPLAYGSFRLTTSGMERVSGVLIQKKNVAAVSEESPGHPDGEAQANLPTVRPEESAPPITYENDRGFGDSGRFSVYKSAVYTVQQDPLRLLIGCPEADVMQYSDEFLPVSVPHFHNAFLQVLCATGVVGLALVLIFCVLAGRRVIRVLYSDAPMTVSILALMLVGILSYNMLESDLFLSSDIICFAAYIAAGAVLAYTYEHDEKASDARCPT